MGQSFTDKIKLNCKFVNRIRKKFRVQNAQKCHDSHGPELVGPYGGRAAPGATVGWSTE